MSRLSKNIFYNLIGKVIPLIISFVAVKYIFGRLGEDALGLIFLTIAMNTVLTTVLNRGVSQTSTREVSSHYHDEPDYIHQLVRTGSLFYWSLFAFLAMMVYSLAPVLVREWITLKSMEHSTAIHVVRVLGMASLVALPKTFYASLFTGLQRLEFNNIIDVSMSALRHLGIIVILAVDGLTLFHVVYWLAFGYVLEILALQITLTRFFSFSALVPGYSSKVVRRNFGFASNMTLVTILWSIYQQADKVVISKLMPIGVLGYYGFAQRATALGGLLTSSINIAAFPAFSSLHRRKDSKQFANQYRKLQDLICFGNVPIVAFIAFAVLPAFSYLLNREAAELLQLPTVLLCIGTYMNSTLRIPITVSLAMGKPEISRDTNFYTLLIVLPLTYVLIRHFGLMGAGLAIVLRMFFFYIYAIPRICAECLGLPAWAWFRHLLKVFVLIFLTYGLAWFVLMVVGNFSLVALAIAYLSATVFFITISYSLIGEELRGTLSGNFVLAKNKILKTA